MKRSRFAGAAVVLNVILAAASLRAAGGPAEAKPEPASPVAGTWSCVQNLPGGQTRSFVLYLRQEGDDLTGSVSVAEGSASVRGKLVADGFQLVVDSEDGTYEVKGKVDGDTIGGRWTLGEATGTWEGKRRAAS